MTTRYKILLSLIVVALLEGCQPKPAQISRSSVAGEESGTSLTISSAQSATVGTAVLITWDAIAQASSYNLTIAYDEKCNDPVVILDKITETSQSFIPTKAVDMYVCLSANVDGTTVSAMNNGYKISVAGSGAASPTPTPALTASKLVFATQPSSSVAGAAITTFTVAAATDSNEVVSNYSGSIVLAIGANPGSGTLSGTLTATAVNGIATFSDININKAGAAYTLLASSGALTGALSAAFNITAGTAATIAFTTQPSNSNRATNISPSIVVTAYDANANVATGFTANVSLAINTLACNGATLSGTLTRAAVAGVATFNDIQIDLPGTTYDLQASSAGLTTVNSNTFNINFAYAAGDGLASGTAYEINTVAMLQDMRCSLNKFHKLTANIDASATSGWNAGAGFYPIGSCGADNDCTATADNVPFTGSLDGNGYKISTLTISRASTDGIGLFGTTNAATLNNVQLASVAISGSDYTGALVGYALGATNIDSSYSTGAVTSGQTITGGLLGYLDTSGTLDTSYSTVTVTGKTTRGGLVGSNAGTISDSFFSGTNTGINWDVGGIAGGNSGTITRSYNSGNVISTSNGQIGGLVGGNSGTISYSYNTGSVSGNTTIGGIIGSGGGTISYVYSTGYLRAYSGGFIGGIAGNLSGGGTISYSFASGIIEYNAANTAGGIAGRIWGGGPTVSNSFWHDHALSPNTCVYDSAGGTVTRCIPKYNGVNPDLNPVSFANNFLENRKVGLSDRSAFRVWGQCVNSGATINIKVTGATTGTATCAYGQFSGTINLAAIADASHTLTIESVHGGCTAGTNCYTDTRTIIKDTSICDGVATHANGFASVGGSDGSAANPWIICSAAHLDNMRNFLGAGVYFRLENNLDLSSGFSGPIAGASTFQGRFDGDGFNVKNLHLHAPTTNNVSIFGAAHTTNTYLSNLTVEDSIVVGANNTSLGSSMTVKSISNFNVSGHVIGLVEYTGGLAAYIWTGGTATNLKSFAHVIGGSSTYASPGIAGVASTGGSVDTLETHGHLIARSQRCGGAIGDIGSSATATNVVSKTHVITSSSIAGGVCGMCGASTFTNSTAYGNVLGDGGVFGGAGYNATTEYAGAFGNGLGAVPSFSGSLAAGKTINSSFAAGDGLGTSSGFVGYNLATITKSFSSSNIFHTTAGYEPGGIVARNDGGTVSHSFATGNIYNTNGATGGIVGYSYSTAAISNSFATGNVQSGTSNSGGFIGINAGTATITKSFATGHVNSSATAAGFAGSNSSTAAPAVQLSFATGSTVGALKGGFVGVNSAGTISNVFYHNHSGNANACFMTNAATITNCMTSPNASQKLWTDVAFAPEFKTGRKVSASDKANFKVWGSCNNFAATISVTASDGATTATNSVKCLAGSWKMTLDLSSLAEGNVTLTAEEQDGSCTPSTNCVTATKTVVKSTTECDSVYTQTAQGFTSGTGANAGNPYLICNRKQLSNVRNYLTSYFKLGNNIDLSGEPWTPICSNAACGTVFTGHLDGNGMRVENMYVNKGGASYCALFGATSGTDAIKNLGVEDVNIICTSISGAVVGSVSAGSPTVQNVYATGNITNSSNKAGGIIGQSVSAGQITNVHSYVNVIAANESGGMLGYTTGNIVTSSSSAGHVICTTNIGCGGVKGAADGGTDTTTNSVSRGNVISAAGYVGGVSGTSRTITNSYATGNIIANGNTGGLAGSATVLVSNSYSTGNIISSHGNTAGLLGYNSADVDNAFATGIVFSTNAATYGGAIGDNTVNTVDNVHYYDHVNNPAVCAAGAGTPGSCSAQGSAAYFYDQSPGAQNEPIASWTFDASNWEWDAAYSVFPILAWENN